MRKLGKALLIILIVVVVLVGGFALFIEIRGVPNYEPGKITLKVESTPARVERGKKIVALLCADCHLDPKTGKLSGKFMDDAPKQFGEIWSHNITQDPDFGIGKFTDGQLAYVLRSSIGPDGHYLPVYMPGAPHMSDEDLYSIIAFLHSNDPIVQPAAIPSHEITNSFLTKFLCFVAFKPLPYPTEKIVAPLQSDSAAYGRYVVQGIGCYECHSADFQTLNVAHPDQSPGYMGGGNGLLTHEQKKILSANITMDPETGIGKWTRTQFMSAVRYGQSPHGALRYPMKPWVQLDSSEINCIWCYLQTVPKIANNVDRSLKD